MTEPCPRCPPFVVRCRHEPRVIIEKRRGVRDFYCIMSPLPPCSFAATRAEADAEFERREGELLGSSALLT